MGLFSRKKSDQTTRSSSRSANSSEAQAAELRSRARRRLIGALVLVLAAVIVVPMMFDDDIDSQQTDTLVVLPAIVPPVPEPDLAIATQPEYTVDEPALPEEAFTESDSATADTDVQGVATVTPEPQQPVQAETPDPEPVAEPTPAAQPERPKTPTPEPARTEAPKPKQTPDDNRTDDGSLALALLEGRVPASAAAAPQAQQQGNFILQIAAYSTEADAQARRSSLVDAGVTNAYVEQGVSNNRTTYRLRVGSFPTRDAAQAAQARLRALGYDNSMLLTR